VIPKPAADVITVLTFLSFKAFLSKAAFLFIYKLIPVKSPNQRAPNPLDGSSSTIL
jgi:hypothetical protein